LAAGGIASAADTVSFSFISEVTDGATCPETITRVYSVSDECGNVSTCEQLLVFNNANPPLVFTCPSDIVVSVNPETFDGGALVNVPLPTINSGCVSGVPQITILSSGQVPLNISPQTNLFTLGVTNFSIGGAPTTTFADVIITGVWNSDNGSSGENPTF